MPKPNRVLIQSIVEKCESVSSVLKSLSHPVRLKILCCLLDKETTVGELTEFCGISQSAMSQFLSRMKDEGMIESRREQQFMYYSISDRSLVKLLRAIKEIYC